MGNGILTSFLCTCYAGVLVQGDLSLVQHIIESWPAASCVEFCGGTEKLLATHNADVHASLKVFVEDT